MTSIESSLKEISHTLKAIERKLDVSEIVRQEIQKEKEKEALRFCKSASETGHSFLGE